MGRRAQERHGRASSRLLSLLAIAAAVAISGCTAAGRHKVLTIFFTGVPPLEEAAAAEVETVDSEETVAGTVGGGQGLPSRLQRVSPFWVHGPYGAGDCASCHLFSQPEPAGVPRSESLIRSGGPPAVGLELTAAEDELCATCHVAQAAETAEALELEIHMPVAAGMCTECHHPHQSRRRYMLRGADDTSLCTECHDPHPVEQEVVAGGDSDGSCTGCHNPHLGKTTLMLRSDYDERIEPYASR